MLEELLSLPFKPRLVSLGTRDSHFFQIYNRVTTHVASYQQRLYDLPVYAHPYVIGAVEATQPYINGALEKAAPLIQTIREKTPVENWIVGTKEVGT